MYLSCEAEKVSMYVCILPSQKREKGKKFVTNLPPRRARSRADDRHSVAIDYQLTR